MRRNPIDTCLSIYCQPFEAVNTYTHDVEDLADYYREYHYESFLGPLLSLA